MALMFHRGLTVPVWLVAVAAIALGAPDRIAPALPALLAINVIAAIAYATLRRDHVSRPILESACHTEQSRSGAGLGFSSSRRTSMSAARWRR
jgi:hypothetical protein